MPKLIVMVNDDPCLDARQIDVVNASFTSEQNEKKNSFQMFVVFVTILFCIENLFNGCKDVCVLLNTHTKAWVKVTKEQ